MIELLAIVALIALVIRISLPLVQNTILAYRLGVASSSVAAGIQQTRYQAIMNGCLYSIAFTAGSTTYQVQSQAISGTPPVCATNADGSPNFTNVASPGAVVSWTSGGGISLLTSTTLEFGPSGIVGPPPSPATSPLVPCAPSCSFQLSNGNTTNTITISGVGSVKVTSP